MGEPAQKRQQSVTEALIALREAMLAEAREAARSEVQALLSSINRPAENEALLSTKQAADYLGISPEAVRKQVMRGHIALEHRGNRKGGMRGNRFSMEALKAFKSRGKSGGDGKEK